MKIRNNKIIGEFHFKNKSVTGNQLHTFVHTRKNGTINIYKFILIDGVDDIEGFKKIRTMFGKTVYRQDGAFRLETLKLIVYNCQEAMAKAGVKLSDLV
tara:strand:+ start:15576 stop:15872 length:297 start_codon:yes stop_codon:yes gene_type:complete